MTSCAGADLETLANSTSALLGTVDSMTEEVLRGPSLLPDWTRAHVVAHVARNADALLNLVRWARTGDPRPMYSSPSARREAIEATAAASCQVLREDVRRSATRLHESLSGITPQQWNRPIHWRHERAPGSAHGIVLLRWAEVEIHHTDLDAGYAFDDWPGRFVEVMLARTVEDREVKGAAVPATLSPVDADALDMDGGGPVVAGTPATLLAWLTGRTRLDCAPELPPWR